ncbi:MAG: hypothetical protein EOP04_18590 [Proteobacteria bacterium]|nr:MAG: hypothetical protein EOP04_18590 [Pseudomonadota bacterium]
MFRVIAVGLLIASLVLKSQAASAAIDKGTQTALFEAFVATFSPEIKVRGLKLAIVIDETSQVDASVVAGDRVAQIHVSRGLLSLGDMNANTLALSLCHELGHVLEGASLQTRTLGLLAEGNADYFASMLCLPRLLDKSSKLFRLGANEEAHDICQALREKQGNATRFCPETVDAALRLTSLHAQAIGGMEASAKLFLAGKEEPRRFALSAQCRLNTFLAGHHNQKSWSTEQILSLYPRKVGLVSDLKEVASARPSQASTTLSKRPACSY